MVQDPLMLYKLIVLYMVNRVAFPLTTAQVSDFLLEKDYTNFLTLQEVLTELCAAQMLSQKTVRNRTLLSITPQGQETLKYFGNRIGDAIRQDIEQYFQEREYALRNETSVLSDYYKATSGEYTARLIVRDGETELINLSLTVPTEKLASSVCENWLKKNQSLYQLLIRELFA